MGAGNTPVSYTHLDVYKRQVVEAAIPNMGLTFKSAQDARGELDTFYNLLNDFDPSMIGGKLPDDGLYYAG